LKSTLINITESPVRFSEVDSMGIVWHGNYAKYFEDGREAFGQQYALSYLDVYHNKFYTPLVKLDFNYKSPLNYGDRMRIETTFINHEAAKIHFKYKIFNLTTGQLATTGESIQVFMNLQKELLIVTPEFFLKWKQEVGLL